MKLQMEIPWLNCAMSLETDIETQKCKYEIYPIMARTNKRGEVINNFLIIYPVLSKSIQIETIDIESSTTAAEILPAVNAIVSLDMIESFEYKINNVHSTSVSLLRGIRYKSNHKFIASWYTNSISAYITTSDNQTHHFDIQHHVYSQKKGSIIEHDTGVPVDMIRIEKSWSDIVWSRF